MDGRTVLVSTAVAGHADERRLPPLGPHRPPRPRAARLRRGVRLAADSSSAPPRAPPPRSTGRARCSTPSAAGGTGTRALPAALSAGWRPRGSRLAGARLPVTAVHGDFWFGNLLSRGGEVTGVVDWEAGAAQGLSAARRRPASRSATASTSTGTPAPGTGCSATAASAAPGSAPGSATPCAATAGSRGSSAASSSSGLLRLGAAARHLVRRRAGRHRRGGGDRERRGVRAPAT